MRLVHVPREFRVQRLTVHLFVIHPEFHSYSVIVAEYPYRSNDSNVPRFGIMYSLSHHCYPAFVGCTDHFNISRIVLVDLMGILRQLATTTPD
jgi:hypothetical protein